MITIVSGTDRTDNLTSVLADFYAQRMQTLSTEKIGFLSLETLPPNLYGASMYKKDTLSDEFIQIQDSLITAADKILFVIPEYNGSFPGILKLFVDACSIRYGGQTFREKKVAMVGIATGRAGNIRGLEHFTSVMMFMGATVLPNLLPLSGFKKLLDAENKLTDAPTQLAIEKQIEAFLKF
jgi:chromate reductase, NAD(P)H dehydrogenase (quinone)